MGCCENLIYRYTVDGILQSSSDDGETWDDAPQDDIRTNAPQFPPIDGEDSADKKCLAAAGMVALIKEQIGDNLTDDMSRYTLSHLISDWVNTFIGTSNPFTALLTVVANQIFALVISAVRAAINDTVYDLLMCIFYCRMANDATFNDGSWGNVRTDITGQIGGVAGIFFEHLVYLLGSRGLTNLARASGATSGDCDDCDCGGCSVVWAKGNVDGNIALGTVTNLGGGLFEITSEEYSDHVNYATMMTPSETECCHVVSLTAVEGFSLPSTGTAAARIVCPLTQHVGNITVGDMITSDSNFNYIAWNSGVAFKIRIQFD